MQQLASRPWATTAVALAGAGMVAAAPVVTPLPNVQIPEISVHDISVQLMSTADVVIDFIRHGESTDNIANLVGTVPTGAGLTDDGITQAKAIGDILKLAQPNLGPNGFGAITSENQVFASEFLRAQQTAWPLLHAILGDSGAGTSMPTELADVGAAIKGLPSDNVLAGLNEINAGLLDKGSLLGSLMQPLGRLNEILYILPPFLWTLGFPIVPEWGSLDNFNGVVFNDNFSGAVNTIYGSLVNQSGELADPSVNNAAAFSHAAAIMAWTQMNVNNPNPLMMFTDPLSNTSQVVVSGNPIDGWVLESWNGTDVLPANLWQDLFVNTRDLMVAPQAALTHLGESLIAFDPSDIPGSLQNVFGTLQTGLTDIFQTTLGYPGAMISDIIDAFQGNFMHEFGIDALMQLFSGLGGGGLLPLDFADLLPSMGGDMAAMVGGDLLASILTSLAF
ncbi:phosphoglycerate mutase family protein [Mycobacterium sp. 1274756.6]|uniref:phosphoglycerate mutase family protein n=1 Tax=Mycobacterium sp. 1274756.6 TaxID=1834076 RepID=UPI000A753771|nr:phosphoglycerate mutase family protein [Mycobacterium sp. 1274756.6]